MTAIVRTIADDVATMLDAATFSQEPDDIVRAYIADYIREENLGLVLYVVAPSQTYTTLNRGADDYTAKILVGVYKLLPDTEMETIDAMVDFTGEVIDVIRKTPIQHAQFQSVTNDPIYDFNTLATTSTYVSIITAEYRCGVNR